MSTGPHTSTPREFAFGPFHLHATERRLTRAGEPVEIGSRALDILIALVERAGEVIGKKGLVARVWPDVIVEESSLRVHVAALRKALGDGVDGARYITNVPGRGYSFVAAVSTPGATAQPQVPTVTAPSAPAPERARIRITNSLPARLTRMVGRDAAVAALTEQLHERRFVTIVGPGGLGKTTVAVSVAHALSSAFSSVIFVDLAAVTDAAGVANGIASTLGLTVRKEDPTLEILAFLRETELLLVLDNCEHVIEAIGSLAERIFMEAPRVHILATSRELLNVEGEHVYALDPLETPDVATNITAARALQYPSVQLFLERAGATSGPLSLSDADAPVVAEICRRLDGLALAVELAAGRVSVFGIRGTAELLEKQFALAWRGRRTALPRHQTLSATLDWSFNLLSEEEKQVLQRLSILVGDFSLAAALAIVGESNDTSDTIEMIASLVAKSLISMRIMDSQPRYRLLEMVRAYAAQRLADSGEAAEIAARHAGYFAHRCQEAQNADPTAVDARDLGNIRSALEWAFSPQGETGIARDLSNAATPILLRWSLLAEARSWSSRALENLPEQDRDSIHESRLIRTLAISTMFTRGNEEPVRVQIARGLDLARRLGDQRLQFEFHTGMHAFTARTGDFRGALNAAAEAANVANDAELASASWMLCMGLHLSGDQMQAAASSEQAIAHELTSSAHGKRYFGYDPRTPGLAVRARILWLTGQTESALQVAKQAIDEGAALHHPVSYCLTLLYATSVYLWSECWADAEQAAEHLAETSSNFSLEPYYAGGRALMGELLHARGDHAAAIPLLSDATRRLNRERQIAQAPYSAMVLADALRATGEFRPALEALDQAIEQRRAGGTSYDMPEMLRIRARILLGMSSDNHGAAVDCLQRGLDLARSQGSRGWELRIVPLLAELNSARPVLAG